MVKENTPPRSIDGFIPQSNAQRRVGFDAGKKPDVKRPENFPGIGQTLSTYTPTIGAAPGSVRPASQAGRLPVSPSPFNLDLEDTTKQPKPKKHRHWYHWKRLLVMFMILVLLAGGWLGFKFLYNAAKTFRGNPLSLFSTTKLNGEDVGRVNILLAGNSSDDVGHEGANLTDSIMVISMDTRNKTAFMLSIPRDLWVEIPGDGHAKINEVYIDGQNEHFKEDGYFPGGMGLLQQVIQNNFNLTLNYYALIDYGALRDMVNAVGGINFTVQSTDKRGLYDPSVDYTTHGPLVKLTNGVHTLNGQQALDLARARGDAYGSYGFPAADFDRTANQRKELLALKSKIASAGVLTNPVAISKLTDSVGKNIKTNMSLSEARRAYDIGKDITAVQSVGLNNVNGKNYLSSYASPRGQSALIPAAGLDDFSDIQALMKRLTSRNPLTREDARIVVLNGTDASGLAATTEKSLTDKGFDVVATGDASGTQPKTTIIDATNGNMTATKSALVKLYGNNVTTTNPYKGIYDADFIVVLGTDRVPKTSTTSP